MRANSDAASKGSRYPPSIFPHPPHTRKERLNDASWQRSTLGIAFGYALRDSESRSFHGADIAGSRETLRDSDAVDDGDEGVGDG
jgi:hypothetical protein